MGALSEREQAQVEHANMSARVPVVFVHGLWLLASSWDRWAELFEQAGYAAVAPGWPDDPETVEEARANPDVLAGKTIGQVADHVAEVIGRLTMKPAVVGHSFGGLLTQIVAGRGLSAVSVAVDPAPFRGVLPLPISALRSASPVLMNPLNWNRAVAAHATSSSATRSRTPCREAEAKELYETYAVPAPGAPLFQAATANLNPWTRGEGRHEEPGARPAADRLRPARPHRSLGDRERVVQAPARNPGVTEIIEIPGRGHALTIDSGWREVRRDGAGVRPALRQS